jgi:hypothetical protein
MFDNYDIQNALSEAQDALSLFERDKNKKSLDAAIQKMISLLSINESRNHLKKYDISFRTTCELGKLYQNRYYISCNEEDLHSGIAFYERARNLMGEFHPDRPSVLNSLGILLEDLFAVECNPLFLEKAIEHFQKAEEFYQGTLAFKSINRNERPIILNSLGIGLRERHAIMGNRADLNDAKVVLENALTLAPKNAPIHPMILNNLALCLRDRFDQDKNLDVLNESIKIWNEALDIQQDPKYKRDIMSNLGEALKHRYIFNYARPDKKEDAVIDLKKAIEFSQKAINFPKITPLDKAIYLGNLGNQLSELYVFLRDSSRLEEANDILDNAIESFEEVITLLPEGSRDRAGSYNNLGRALRNKYNLTSDGSHLLKSFDAFDKASKSLSIASYDASISYKFGVRKMLGGIDDMPIETALTLRDLASKDPNIVGIHKLNWGRAAMIHAEGIKSSILVELLGRRDIQAPKSVPSNLIEEEEKLLKEINKIDSRDISRFDEHSISTENPNARPSRLQKRQELISELEDLWTQMESYGPESKEYAALRRGDRPSWEDIKNLAQDASTALLSLFPLAERTVLFILRASWEEPEIVDIPFGSDAQSDMWHRFRREVHLYAHGSQIEETWDRNVIRLLEEARGYLNGVNQVIFSPGRFGCLLPWEALLQRAGLDIDWTAIPNLKIWSLLAKTGDRKKDSSLVIGNPKKDLISAETEACRVAELLKTTPLIGNHATRETVLKYLPNVDIAHFATHAYFSLTNPLDSGIVLADGVLTVRPEFIRYHPI